MKSDNRNNSVRSIGNFAAMKTAIVNGEAQLLKELIPTQPMIEIEKSYLIDLANLNNNPTILKLLEDIPVKK